MKINTKSRDLSFFALYDKFIADSKTASRLQSNGKRIAANTILNYSNTKKLLLKFCIAKGFTLRIRGIQGLGKKQLLDERNYWKKFYQQFTGYLYEDCNHFDNYVGQNIRIIKTFFNYLNEELLIGVGIFHQSFYVMNEQIPVIALMPEELRFFICNKNFEAQLTKQLSKVKDVFVFSCTVALRFSDLMALTTRNLRIASDKYYLLVRSKKTAADSGIRLPGYAVDIIQKYAGKYSTLLPRFDKTTLNERLKQLAEHAGLTQVLGKIRSKQGKQIEIQGHAGGNEKNTWRFCDLVTTHTMRRTAITTMLTMGVPEQLVRKISGHAPGSKEFFKYVDFAQSYQDGETEKMFELLKEDTPLNENG